MSPELRLLVIGVLAISASACCGIAAGTGFALWRKYHRKRDLCSFISGVAGTLAIYFALRTWG